MDWIRISIPESLLEQQDLNLPIIRFESSSEEKEETKAMDSNPRKKDSIPFEALSNTSEKRKKPDSNPFYNDSNT